LKLIIQIPCYNEEQTLPETLSQLPREVEGFTKVEWLIVNDGCTDNTSEVARKHGVDHIICFNKNKGLASAFMAGIDACIKLGADVIVNTDADNQYNAADIPNLTRPVIEGKADIVIGARPIEEIKHFSPFKKLLQKLGSYTVRLVSNTKVQDAPSGFRAFSKDAAMRLNVFSKYTYTLETIIQAGEKNMSILSVPVRVNRDLRRSKLVKSVSDYIKISILTMLRFFVVYNPFKYFFYIGFALFWLGFIIGLRYIYFLIVDQSSGHIQSLILSAILLGMGFQTILVAFMADLLAVNRKMLEDIQYKLRKQEEKSKILSGERL